MKLIYFFLLLIIATPTVAQNLHWTDITPVTDASFRGLSVVNDKVIWVSGSKGWVGRSVDGGTTWEYTQLKGFEKLEFRSLYAFNAETAVIANAGSPASVMRTTDGGKTWKEMYRNENPDAFFDGVDFWNEREGLIYGDPLKGKIFLLQTRDGGVTWEEVTETHRPSVADGEASFAASGTGIRCLDKNRLVMATGGKLSRLFISYDKAQTWRIVDVPMIQGESTTGIFSVAFRDKENAIVVGGDYQRDSLAVKHVFYTTDGGKTWIAPEKPTRGYRECVEYLGDNVVVAIGPRGADISRDNGKTWEPFSDQKGFHVVRKARSGRRVVAAGGKGMIALLR